MGWWLACRAKTRSRRTIGKHTGSDSLWSQRHDSGKCVTSKTGPSSMDGQMIEWKRKARAQVLGRSHEQESRWRLRNNAEVVSELSVVVALFGPRMRPDTCCAISVLSTLPEEDAVRYDRCW